MAVDVSRASFTEATAPRNQYCSCGCGTRIHRGDTVYARQQCGGRNRSGTSRIIDMEDHYRDWLEKVAHEYAQVISARHPQLKRYFGYKR